MESNLLQTDISHCFSIEYSSGAPFYLSWTAASEELLYNKSVCTKTKIPIKSASHITIFMKL